MKAVVNVNERKEYDGFPRVIENCLNPPIDVLAKHGWYRLVGDEPKPRDGYRIMVTDYAVDTEAMTARKVITSEVSIAAEQAAATVAAEAAQIESDKAALAALDTQVADCVDSLTMRVLIALAGAGTKLTAESAYIEARKQLGLK